MQPTREIVSASVASRRLAFFGSKLERGASHAITNREPDVNNLE